MATPVLSEYVKAFQAGKLDLDQERKKVLKRISDARGGRDIIVYGADLAQRQGANNGIEYLDILPFHDQLASLPNKTREIDIIIETPGGLAEVAEQMVKMVRSRYDRVGMIVPGWAKSAGTIFVMAGDEILMGETSALGPIDPQIIRQGKSWSANAFIDGLDKIKEEVKKTGLNPAYYPILQAISPGEIQACQNAKEFSQKLVRNWLVEYKFKYWKQHETRGTPVGIDEKQEQAAKVAAALSDHATWLTHGRSIGIDELTKIGLKITDYSVMGGLGEAINRYYALLRLTFESPVYKIYETPFSQVKKMVIAPGAVPQAAGLDQVGPGTPSALVKFGCRCGKELITQLNFVPGMPLTPGAVAFPLDTNKVICPHCRDENDLTAQRKLVEQKTGKPAI